MLDLSSWFYEPFVTVWAALKSRKELLAMKKIDKNESDMLARYNEIVIDGLCDAERTRTSELLFYRNWRDDVTVEEAIDMAKQIEKVRGK